MRRSVFSSYGSMVLFCELGEKYLGCLFFFSIARFCEHGKKKDKISVLSGSRSLTLFLRARREKISVLAISFFHCSFLEAWQEDKIGVLTISFSTALFLEHAEKCLALAVELTFPAQNRRGHSKLKQK